MQERANTSSETAKALYDIADTKLKANGFAYGEGASLRRTFEGEWACIASLDHHFAKPVPSKLNTFLFLFGLVGLKEESAQVAKAHDHVADSLDHMVLRPFTTWSHAHEGRITDMIDQLDNAVKEWEGLSNEVMFNLLLFSPTCLMCFFRFANCVNTATSNVAF